MFNNSSFFQQPSVQHGDDFYQVLNDMKHKICLDACGNDLMCRFLTHICLPDVGLILSIVLLLVCVYVLMQSLRREVPELLRLN